MLFNEDNTEFNSRLLLRTRSNSSAAAISILKEENDFYDAVDAAGCTLLHHAVECANVAITRHLIEFGANVDAKDHRGNTPLMLAIQSPTNSFGSAFREAFRRKDDIVKMLLASNANIHLRDENGKSVWQMLSLKDSSIVRLLMQKLSNECANRGTIIDETLINANCPLPIAVLMGSVNLVRLMLSRGFPVIEPKTKESALCVAIDELNADIMKIILESGANLRAKNVSGYTPMSWFGLNYKNTEKHLSVLKVLLDYGAQKFDEGGDMAISAVLEKGNRQTISLLFRYDLDCRKKDAKGRTALHYLASNSHSGIVQEVNNEDFDFNRADREGLTALHFSLGNPEFMEFLIKHGVDVNSTGKGSAMSPLFSAFSSLRCPFVEKMKTIELLLKHGADPQATYEGNSIFENTLIEHEQELTIEPIIARLVELEAAGTTIDECITSRIQKHAYLKSRYEAFHRKIVRMKQCLVYDSINLFTLLSVSERQFARYMRNRELAAKFVKLEDRVAFVVDSYFCNVLRRRRAEVVEMTRLRKNVADVIFEVSGFHHDRHHIIVDSILGNFSLDELRRFDL